MSLNGSFGFRVSGPFAPYYGLAGVESNVTRSGRRDHRKRLIEHGVTPTPHYTELDGEVLGWVSYLTCQTDRQQEAMDEGVQKRAWWSRGKPRATELSMF